MIFNFLKKKDIGNPPWDYYHLLNLDEKEYSKYLAKLFYLKTGEKLPLLKKLKVENGKLKVNYEIDKSKCKTFNQKIQWIKLYGITELMRKCTDKVGVRDYVKEKIGEEYLKPILQICDKFDQIDFDSLPNSFVIKCNHGCKWHFIVKNKEKYLENPRLINITRRQITGWLSQEFWCYAGFEIQYRNIKPQIIIEPLLRENENREADEIFVYCFNGKAKYIVCLYAQGKEGITPYDEELNITEDIFGNSETIIQKPVSEKVRKAIELSEKLSDDFCFVRVDWMTYKNKLYFEELTFTPYSGFQKLKTPEYDLKLGSLINLERFKNEL